MKVSREQRAAEIQESIRQILFRDWDPIGVNHNPKLADDAAEPPELARLLHETIRKVGADIEAMRFNTAISQMMILSNAIQKMERVRRSTALAFVQLLAPFAPHIAEELWARLGGSGPLQGAPWPQFDPGRIASGEQKLVFQVNGRHRGDQLVPAGLPQDDALRLAGAHPRVAPHLEGKAVKKVIYVPGRIINIVTG